MTIPSHQGLFNSVLHEVILFLSPSLGNEWMTDPYQTTPSKHPMFPRFVYIIPIKDYTCISIIVELHQIKAMDDHLVTPTSC